jgi:aminoglycoside 6'-N-acetyltransferase I
VSAVTVRQIVERDRSDWVRLRDGLWPGTLTDHEQETLAFFETPVEWPAVFVAEAGQRVIGFLELDLRKYAPGCSTSPVPSIEGWYVDAASRGRRIGRALVNAAEAHAREAGYHEIASDAELTNAPSIAAHRALGFDEIERVVCIRRSLGEPR